MAPRKGGGGGGSGGKKKGAKKRKSNVWDDYTAPVKGAGRGGVDEDGQPQKKAKRESKESMFGQWKKHKQLFNNKKKSFHSTVDQKKHAQREQYLALKQQHADALYDGAELSSRLTKSQKKKRRAQRNAAESESDDSNSDNENSYSDESDGDELMVTKKKKRSSVFDQFVQTFQPAARGRLYEDEEEDNDEDEYEEVLVNEDGVEIDEDGNVINRDDDDDEEDATEQEELDDDDDAEDEVQVNDEEEEDEQEEADDKEQLELAQDQDPYRRRYLLTDFDERDAKQFDALPKKFTLLAPQNAQGQVIHYASPSEYSVSHRNGSSTGDDQVSPVNNKLYVRSRLLDAWKAKELDPETLWTPTSLEYSLFHQFSSYKDVFYAAQTYESTETLRRLSAMHVLNHIVKSRDTVARNNERLRKRQAKDKETTAEPAVVEPPITATATLQDEDEKEYRDQGFCRATVLVLLPLRSSALAFVKLLLELLPANVDTFHNKDRFFNEYGSAKDDDDEDENEDVKAQDKDGLKEWQKVFAEGNNDDSFQIGLSLSRKALRFYSEYHHADIILASPLGLRQQLGDEVVDLDSTDAADDVRLSTDFLTSIEVCVVDSASLMLMQNVEHLRHVVRAVNVQPKEAPNADFARLREWNLAFLGAYFRQTIVFAHGVEPALNHLVTKCCKNQSGLVKYVKRFDPADGSAAISRVVPQVKQIFQRVDVDVGGATLSATSEVDVRFEYFKKHVFEPLLDHPKKHVLIFVPSYFDYVRVRNLFNDSMNKKLIRSVQCCEYTTNKQVSRARTSFFHGKAHVLLATERFHFYHQYQLRGVHQIIWYGLPQLGGFYPEMLNMLGDTTTSASESHGAGTEDAVDVANALESRSSIALFTRLDLFRMQRIVGDKRAERMCQPKAAKPTFLFC